MSSGVPGERGGKASVSCWRSPEAPEKQGCAKKGEEMMKGQLMAADQMTELLLPPRKPAVPAPIVPGRILHDRCN